MELEQLRVEKIRDGTVIDHIPSGRAMAVLRILGITGREGHVVSVLMNVPSGRLGKKDVVKIEGRELVPKEVEEIALIAPNATINIIRGYKVTEKNKVQLPKAIRGILHCPNPVCITNTNEPVSTLFHAEGGERPLFHCYYCGYLMDEGDVVKQF